MTWAEKAFPEHFQAMERFYTALAAETGALLAPGKTAVFFGDGSDAYRQALEDSGLPHVFAPQQDKFQKACSVLKLAFELYAEGDLTDAYGAEPVYLRQAEAERKLKAGELGKKKAKP